MDPTVFIGIIIGVGLLIKAIGLELGMKLFYHPDSLMVVLGGTLGATFVHFPISQLFKLGPRLRVIFSFRTSNYFRDIQQVVKLAEIAKREGRLALEKEVKTIKDHFLKTAVQFLIDKVEPEEMAKIMRENILYMKKRHDLGIKFFERMASYAPGFGLIGTLIGLIMMLAELDDPSSLGPSMSIALVTTFYGVLLANLIFLPLGGRLRISSNEEQMQKEMLLEGIYSMAKGESTYIIREKMSMLLPHKERIQLEKKFKKALSDGAG